MARVTKDCPSCGSPKPCTITLIPPTELQPPPDHNVVTYKVTCDECGHEYDSDSSEIVHDAKKWAKEKRKQHGKVEP